MATIALVNQMRPDDYFSMMTLFYGRSLDAHGHTIENDDPAVYVLITSCFVDPEEMQRMYQQLRQRGKPIIVADATPRQSQIRMEQGDIYFNFYPLFKREKSPRRIMGILVEQALEQYL
ncbi:hypothetical protein C4573_05170 [Candidatus Woesearchaeota archaeon]|nr:MAG: hypothetical protein C4573_05170 [Candidatus Woesearchaeota archaeon]